MNSFPDTETEAQVSLDKASGKTAVETQANSINVLASASKAIPPVRNHVPQVFVAESSLYHITY